MEATATLTNNNISVTSARTARKAGENSDLPANCRPFEDFAVALKKAVKQHYEKI
ncbi:MAG: hypothetical protein IKO34_11130 [Bacteroidales bacterium]|nr:hypothetical protein [Bacteroidales bacterium]